MNVIKYPQKECPLCESKSDKFVKDFMREEVYCGVCGCVLIDTSIPSVSILEFIVSLDQDNESDDSSEENILKNFNRKNHKLKKDSKANDNDLKNE